MLLDIESGFGIIATTGESNSTKKKKIEVCAKEIKLSMELNEWIEGGCKKLVGKRLDLLAEFKQEKIGFIKKRLWEN